jgi:hypothetical protein
MAHGRIRRWFGRTVLRGRTNCLFWTASMLIRHGGYVLVRSSPNYPGPHFIWGKTRRDGTVRVAQIEPAHAVRRLFPPPMFRTVVCFGDKDGLRPSWWASRG